MKLKMRMGWSTLVSINVTANSSKEAMMVEELWADKVYELANQPCVYVPFQT